MHVKELANELGINRDTIRDYTRIELLKPTKDPSGYKSYGVRERRSCLGGLAMKATWLRDLNEEG